MFINYLNNENAEKYAYNDNIVIRTADDSNKITTNLYNVLKHKFQDTLENKMGGSSFVFDYVIFLDLKFNQVDLIRGGTYTETPKWDGYLIKKRLLILEMIKMMVTIVSCMP